MGAKGIPLPPHIHSRRCSELQNRRFPHSHLFTHTADVRRFSTSDELTSVCDVTERREGARFAAGGAESESKSAQFITPVPGDQVFLEPVGTDSSRSVTVAPQLLWSLL